MPRVVVELAVLLPIPVSALDFVGINEATSRAHITKNAPNTNGGPGTNYTQNKVIIKTVPHKKQLY